MVVKVSIQGARGGARGGRSPAEGCGLLLTRLARAANRSLACALAELGLRSQQFAILNLLAGRGPLAQAELAAALRLHPPNLVRVLDEMEEVGLVRRERDEGDRRRRLVALTRAGAVMLRRAEAIAAEMEQELLAPLDPAERERLHALLDRLATHACDGRQRDSRSPAGASAQPVVI